MSNEPQKRRNRLLSLLSLNIGTFIFGAILIYIVVCMFIYATTKHITSYQVTSGPLASNQTYTALAIREETVVDADGDGYVNYYAQDSKKIRLGGAVYSLSDTQPSSTGSLELSEESLSKVREYVAQFANSFDTTQFNDVYSFKYSLNSNIQNYASLDAENAVDALTDASDSGDSSEGEEDSDDTLETYTYVSDGEKVSYAGYNGIVTYYTDGYEDITADDISADLFAQGSYQYTNLKTTERVTSGTPVYKMITDDNWYILIQLSETQAASLEGIESIKVKFNKDDSIITGDLTILDKSDGIYARIDFSTGMSRFCTDRFLTVELVTNSKTGLKIPVSSITEKEFYIIPKDYAVAVESNTETGFLRLVNSSGGKETTEVVSAVVYEASDDYYYVDKSDFSEGDILIMENTNQRYEIGETDILQGVYCINRGYAMFRKIRILDQNEEYAIVETGTSYGLSLYDNIVLDSTTVTEEEILYD